jgi:hypothetical protein
LVVIVFADKQALACGGLSVYTKFCTPSQSDYGVDHTEDSYPRVTSTCGPCHGLAFDEQQHIGSRPQPIPRAGNSNKQSLNFKAPARIEPGRRRGAASSLWRKRILRWRNRVFLPNLAFFVFDLQLTAALILQTPPSRIRGLLLGCV